MIVAKSKVEEKTENIAESKEAIKKVIKEPTVNDMLIAAKKIQTQINEKDKAKT